MSTLKAKNFKKILLFFLLWGFFLIGGRGLALPLNVFTPSEVLDLLEGHFKVNDVFLDVIYKPPVFLIRIDKPKITRKDAKENMRKLCEFVEFEPYIFRAVNFKQIKVSNLDGYQGFLLEINKQGCSLMFARDYSLKELDDRFFYKLKSF